MNFYHARESFVGYFADSALYPGLVFSILARQGIPGVGFRIDSKSMECMMVMNCIRDLKFIFESQPLLKTLLGPFHFSSKILSGFLWGRKSSILRTAVLYIKVTCRGTGWFLAVCLRRASHLRSAPCESTKATCLVASARHLRVR